MANGRSRAWVLCVCLRVREHHRRSHIDSSWLQNRFGDQPKELLSIVPCVGTVCPYARVVLPTCWSLCVAAVASAGEPPHATSSTVPVHYQAPASCPSEDAFRAEIGRRLTRTAIDPKAGTGREFVVTITARNGVFSGSLLSDQRGRQEHVRDLEGVDCDDVARSLAFVVAVLIDPGAATRSGGRPQSMSSAVHLPAPPPPLVTRPEPQAPRWRVAFSSEIDLLSAVAPHAVVSPRIGSAVVRIGSDGNRLASVGLSIAHASSGRIAGTWGDLATYWTAARLEGCGPRWGSKLGAQPCGWLDLGEIQGKAAGTLHTTDRNALWLALGALVRAGFELFDSVTLDVSLGGFAPLVRPRFYIAGADGTRLETLHEVPRLGITFGVGITGNL